MMRVRSDRWAAGRRRVPARPALRRALVMLTAGMIGVTMTGIAPYQQTPAQAAQAVKDAVLAQVLEAAAPTRTAENDVEKELERDRAPRAATGDADADARRTEENDERQSRGGSSEHRKMKRLAHKRWASGGTRFRIDAPQLDVGAQFSGYRVADELEVAVSELPTDLAESAAEQTGGSVVGSAFEITAKTAEGEDRTDFPAKTVELTPASEDAPARVDVTPGLKLTVRVAGDKAAPAGVDPRTLKMYTRETDADPWVLLPSYYDQAARTVVAESTHLSQFAVIGTPWEAPERPRVMLDPDQNIGYADTPASVTEGPYNVQLAKDAAAGLEQACLAVVGLTGTDKDSMVSDATRAGIAENFEPNATVTLAFNAAVGHAWGEDASSGGTQVYNRRHRGSDTELTKSFDATMPKYTGRPSQAMPAMDWPPGSAFNGVPGAMTHLETLFLDNNYDWAVINDSDGWKAIVNGVVASIGKYLESEGFDCSDPATGGLPDAPSKAQRDKWRKLGHQNFQTYGAEPISFSTGNLIEDIPTFSLPGEGGQALDGTLSYNSQDGRLSRVGAGWSFGYGARMQRFSDGSVLVVRGDGASFTFAPDGSGGYETDAGAHLSLTEAGGSTWRVKDPDGETWIFETTGVEGVGHLTEITDRGGRTTTLSYGKAGDNAEFMPLKRITDSSGQRIEVTSDSRGRITAFALPDGREWKLAYDGAGDLIRITDPDGGARKFTYDDEHRMLTATDPLGVRYLSNTYDSSGRVVKQVDGDGKTRKIAYSAGRTVYTDQNGQETTYRYDSASRVTSIAQPGEKPATYIYHDDDTVATFTDSAGRSWAYEYDGAGNITEQTLPDGTRVAYEYSSRGDLTGITDQGGPSGASRTTAFEVDAHGNRVAIHQPDGTTIRQTFDDAGNLTKTSLPSGAEVRYVYDAHGRLTSQTDPDGVVTRYAYDEAGQVTRVTDGLGNATKLTWTGTGLIATSTDPRGGVTKYGYDKNGNLTTLTDPTGAVTKYAWDRAWNQTSVTDAAGAVTRTAYDAENNATGVTDPAGASTKFILDELGRAVTTVDPNGGEWGTAYDEAGNVVTATDPSGAVTKYAYDQLDRLVKTTDAAGAQTSYVYDAVGRIVSATDAVGGTIGYTYDLMDRVTGVTDQAGNATSYVYDVDGNRVGTIDRQGNPTAYAYTKAGRLKSETDQLGAVVSYVYDAAGNLAQVKDPLGRVTAHGYDANGQLVTVTDPAGGVTTYGYDKAGRQTSVTDQADRTNRVVFDKAGRVVQAIDPAGGITRYAYDKIGRQTRSTDPAGRVTAYGYDVAGQLTSVTENPTADGVPTVSQNVTTAYEHDVVGNLTRIVDPNGNPDRFAYDAVGNLIEEVNAKGASWKYGYDALGRVTREDTPTGAIRYGYTQTGDLATQKAGGAVTSYSYDREQRLIAASNPQGVVGYEYDAAGRLTRQLDTQGRQLGYAYDAAGQLTSLTLPSTKGGEKSKRTQRVGYAYDDAGNLVGQTSPWGSLGYSYDGSGLLTQVQRTGAAAVSGAGTTGAGKPGPTTHYSYDPAGRVTSILTGTIAGGAAAKAPGRASKFVKQKDLGPCATVTVDRADEVPEHPAGCLSDADYVKRRTLPTAADPVSGGEALQLTYQYDAAGNTTQAARGIGVLANTGVLSGAAASGQPTPATVTGVGATAESLLAVTAAGSKSPAAGIRTAGYAYDSLSRLAGSTLSNSAGADAADSTTVGYSYDAASNRVGTVLTDGSGTSRTTASYNALGQLTKTKTSGARAGTASYAYDASGNRVSQKVDGVTTSFGYDALGQLTGVKDPTRETSFGYDGAGDRVAQTDTTKLGAVTTGTLFASGVPVQTDNSVAGITSLLYDQAGGLVLEGRTEVQRWDLLDRLGSTVAQTAGSGQVAQLSGYGDWGAPGFETPGWDAAAGFTGELQDPGYGLDLFHARAYDPVTGVWTGQDQFRGLLTVPQSLNRYGYVAQNPLTLTDVGGYSWFGDLVNGVKKVVNRVVNTVKAVVNVVKTVAVAKVVRAARTVQVATNAVKSVATRVVSATGALINMPGAVMNGAISSQVAAARAAGVYDAIGNTPQVMSYAIWKAMHPKVTPQDVTKMKTEVSDIRQKVEFAGALARLIRNLPLTSVGSTVARVTDAKCSRLEGGIILCSGARGFGSNGTMTLGNVILTGRTQDAFRKDKKLMQHEISHATESAMMGNDIYGALWVNGLLVSKLLDQYDKSGGGGCLNLLERFAAPGGGYQDLCARKKK